MKRKWKYTVKSDADRMAPKWLAIRIDDDMIKFIYVIDNGTAKLKGVRINHEFAKIGDTVCFDGKRLSVERR
jgi:hypothetical protein